ncbi:MAG: hypothetical protein RLY40_1432, partial [Pseudomonadota bacterium]
MKIRYLDKKVIPNENKLPLQKNTLLLKRRTKRAGDGETLETATARSYYKYWLSQEDIADIARVEYGNYRKAGESSSAEFEVLGSISQLTARLEAFQLAVSKKTTNRLTMIINLANFHWVTLVVVFKDSSYIGYYTDSKNNPLPYDYYQLLIERFKIQPLSLSPGFAQQMDEHNCGLWALENAQDICWMLEDDARSLYLAITKLRKPRDEKYFEGRRRFLSEKLRADPERHARYLSSETDISDAKHDKFSSQPEEKVKLNELLETFVETFITSIIKKIGAYHITAKGERLTEEALKNELKTGLTGGLLGIALSQSIVGAIPSLVASLRLLSSKYYLSKAKAQKITKAFSETGSNLCPMLSEAAINVFYSFESQFMRVTDKAGKKIAMEKLAEDAAERALNYIAKHDRQQTLISKQLIEKSVLLGQSEKFFDPNIKPARLRISGNTILDEAGNEVNTANLYEKVGLIVRSAQSQPIKFYKNKQRTDSNHYGYRRLLEWEREDNGELKEVYKEQYEEEFFPQKENPFQFRSRRYDYILEKEVLLTKAQAILTKFENRYSQQPVANTQKAVTKTPILFNLRKPIQSFTGRSNILSQLHHLLIRDRTIAVIPSLSSLLISQADSNLPKSGSQISISGLGGIGKTQLVLRYAELYAAEYDYNVLWIDAETKENIAYSFLRLANKLKLDIKNHYDQEKTTEEIVEEVYDYFSDRKSLFILDNVENHRTIEPCLPKSMLGNKPTLLITSRYSNWKNIASTLLLDVFTHEEAKELANKILKSQTINIEKINELNMLLQGLPLALQQALAYISLRENTYAEFSIDDYIALYKEKTQELLSFDFSNYSNDPYIKTVFTTWQITLDKIRSQPYGEKAIEILNMISYLDPDNITSAVFYRLRYLHYSQIDHNIDAGLNLLNSYSMINLDNLSNKYTIHRLVQQVVRMQLEIDRTKFIETIERIQKLFVYYKFTNDENFHFLHFLLYMSEYKGLENILLFGEASRILFSKLIDQDIKYWFYFLDLAHIKFKKEKYLEFLGDALAFCLKKNSLFFTSETLNYIEKKWEKGNLSKENVKYIIEYVYALKNSAIAVFRISKIPQKRARQQELLKLLYFFREKVFGGIVLYLHCQSRPLKRSIDPCLLTQAEEESKGKIKTAQNFRSHVEKIAQISQWLNTGLLTKTTLSALVQGDFNTIAVNIGLITSSQILGEISSSLRQSGELLAMDSGLLVEKNLAIKGKAAFQILFNEEVLSSSKRRFFGNALKVTSPFIARGTSVFFAYNFMNELKAYKAGNETLLPDVISNGVIVSIDGVEAGVEASEFLGFITGISEFTGPVGEGITVLTWL